MVMAMVLGLGVIVRAVDALLEDGFCLVDLPFCFELPDVVGYGAAVGPAPGLVEVEVFVEYLAADAAPITLTAAVLLGLARILVGESRLGEELWRARLARLPLEVGLVVTGIELLSTSHVDDQRLLKGRRDKIAQCLCERRCVCQALNY